jgi:pyruvate,orthophosphate dikinase
MGKPAVVGAANLTVEDGVGVRAGSRVLPEGALIAVDGTGGEVVVGSPRVVSAATDPRLHRLLSWADDIAGRAPDGDEAARLTAARTLLLRRQETSEPDERNA